MCLSLDPGLITLVIPIEPCGIWPTSDMTPTGRGEAPRTAGPGSGLGKWKRAPACARALSRLPNGPDFEPLRDVASGYAGGATYPTVRELVNVTTLIPAPGSMHEAADPSPLTTCGSDPPSVLS